MTDSIMQYQFTNSTAAPLAVWLEPWAEEITVGPGSKLVLKIHYVEIDTMETVQTDTLFVIWLWRGCRVQVFVDGKDRTSAAMSIPAPV